MGNRHEYVADQTKPEQLAMKEAQDAYDEACEASHAAARMVRIAGHALDDASQRADEKWDEMHNE